MYGQGHRAEAVRSRVIRYGDGLGWGTSADEHRVLITLDDGVPVARVRVPDPGAVTPDFERVLLDPHADGHRSYFELRDRLRRRLGMAERSLQRPSCSVVVCTHRRPELLAKLLGALRLLDPAADQIVVVDNDPGDAHVRAMVEAAGALYVREERRGLDHARAAGLAAARCELVAFVDDDCMPAARWLRDLPELFDDPCVGAVTGPAFAFDLDAPAKVAFEDSGGFGRGLQRRVHEWSQLAPPAATRAGAGANMIFRRSLALSLGELFPPELDAGTPTESGGDLYALYKVLAAGHRVVYDPGTYVLHQHRPDLDAMRRAIHGYGVGLSAALTKLLVEERELAAPAVWWWLVAQYLEARVRSLAGRAGAHEREIASLYLRGGFRGPRVWLRSRAGSRVSGLGSRERPRPARSARGPAKVSVIVTTHERPSALRRCLDALAAQTEPFELIVVNDGRAAVGPFDGARVIHTGGVGTAGARNAGAAAASKPLLLFLDDDLVPAPDLVLRHSEAHREGERVVVGYCAPRPRTSNLTSLGASAWWEDHYRATRTAVTPTFVDVLSGNMSVPRTTFERLGGFDPALGRREDWEWGIRVLEAGIEVACEPRAQAEHEFTLSAHRSIDAARRDGRSDARLIERYPAAAGSLPQRWAYRSMLKRPIKAALFLALQRKLPRALAAVTLDALELAKARVVWSRLFTLMLGAAYERGRRQGGDSRRPRVPVPPLDIELCSDEAIPAPAVASPRIRLLVGGEPLAELSPKGGHWGESLADQIASIGHWQWWEASQGRDGRPVDTSGVLVLLGPDDAGTAAQRVEYWRRLDRAIRSTTAHTVAIPLHAAAPDADWLRGVLPALDAERVAFAAGAADDGPPRPVTLHSRATAPEPFPMLGRPARYVALRRSAYQALGGFCMESARIGNEAVVLELTERALSAGWLVALRDTPGLRPAERERAASLRCTRARAALLARRAWENGERPPLTPAVARLAAGAVPGGPTFTGGIAHGAAWLAGLRYHRPAPPDTAERTSGVASQRWPGTSKPSPAERPVTHSG
jgi:GT2 family glycosyltransferase